MTLRQQQPYYSYEHYANQLLSSEELSPPRDNLIKLAPIAPIEITYQPIPLRKARKSVIHDITRLTRRRSPIYESSPLTKSELHREIPQRKRSGGRRCLQVQKFQTVPTPRVQIQRLRVELRERQEQEDHYLQHNSGIVKDKIRSKFMRHRTDFAEIPSKTRTEPRQPTQRTPKRTRIDRYNHDFEEYLIRKRIGRREEEQPQNMKTVPSQSNRQQMQQELSHKTERHEGEEMIVKGRKRRISPNLYCSTEIEGPRLIIVSPMHPNHAINNFKNYMITSATKSCQKQEAEGLLRRYVDRNFKARKQSQGEKAGKAVGGNLVKSPLNYTLFKKQVHKMRKESIGLPLLLENHESQQSGSLLEERINARKISCMATVPQDEGKTLTKKYVVFSRKNVTNVVDSSEQSS